MLGKDKYRLNYFRNIHIFDINHLSFDISENFTVPEHKPIRKSHEIAEILEKTNTKSGQLPVILRTDAMAKLIRLCPGDICEINRKSERCGEYKYYRICK